MRIALINPPFKMEHGRFSRSSRSPAITKSGTLYYPIWLAYACGYLEKHGHEVLLVDSCAERIDLDATAARVEAFGPQLVVVDTSTPSIHEDVRSAGRLKLTSSSPLVCLVGTHPSALPEEVMAMNEHVDCIARREYDQTLLELAEAIESRQDFGSVAGICYRRDGAVISTPDRAYIEDLDAFPLVSEVYKKHLRVEDYFFSAGEYPMAMIMTGRGCPSRCFFCVYPQTFHGHKYRLRSAMSVVDEFEYIARELPQVKSVGIEDDTFTANTARVREICQLLIERGLHKKLHWWANTRVSLDGETMKLMKKAGCRLTIPGFESGDQKILNGIKKGITLEQSRRYVAAAQDAGLLVHGCFMVGNKGETAETMKQTVDFAILNNPDTYTQHRKVNQDPMSVSTVALASAWPVPICSGSKMSPPVEGSGSTQMRRSACARVLTSRPRFALKRGAGTRDNSELPLRLEARNMVRTPPAPAPAKPESCHTG